MATLWQRMAVRRLRRAAGRGDGEATGGQIVLSARVADGLEAPVGERVELELKGKRAPEPAYRVSEPS
jgi:class 3 adenylate cyclase